MSSYLPYLPAVLRQSPFLGRFLLAFEAVLSGVDPASIPDDASLDDVRDLKGIERVLDGIDRYFDPLRTDPEFLPWLAQWVATSLRDDWSEETKQKFLANIVPLYRERGTRAGIEKVLHLSGDEAQVVDFHDGLHESLEAVHFPFNPKPPHFFGVILTVSERDPAKLARQTRRVRAIVDREKPAHAVYGLRILYPAMRINNAKSNTAFGPGLTISSTNPLVLGTTKV
ncbi:phage tail protein [Sorangium sp. So ce375]|uniref:phage tail protein n=1 Tax=Sorangium sp. So ce375 TaxID=3133306 RepID=UPI003F5C5C77